MQKFVNDLDTGRLSAHEIKAAIFADVRQFTGTARQFDDMTIVVIKVQ